MKAWTFQDRKQLEKLGADDCPWSVGYYDPDGKRKSKSIGTRSNAEKYQRRIEGQLAAGTYDERSRKTWAGFRQEYEDRIMPKWRSNASRLDSQRALDLVEELIAPALVRAIDDRKLDQYVALRLVMRGKRIGDTVSRETVRKELRAIRAALNVARRWGYVKAVPEMPELDTFRRDKPFVTEADFNAILNHCEAAKFPADQHYTAEDFWKALLGLAMVTGMRKSAMLALLWPDVDLDDGYALSRAEDNKGKRDQRHNVKPVADLLDTLHRVRRPGDDRVFAWNHALITLDRELLRIQKAAGIDLPCAAKHEHTDYCHVYGFHSFRYGFAQHNAEQMTTEQLQEQMGHRSATTTQRYIDYAKRQKQARVEVFVPAALKRAATA